MDMNRDLDQMTFDLIKEMSDNRLQKMLPPKLKYRIRHWLRSLGVKGVSPNRAKQLITQKFEEELVVRSLAKNESLASFFEDRVVKFDFGANVSPGAKKAALEWAKKRGLKPVEASLTKSTNASGQVVLAPEGVKADPFAKCLRRVRFET